MSAIITGWPGILTCVCFDPFALSKAEITLIAFQELFGKSSELTHWQGVKNDPSPRLFVVKNGRSIQHVFEGDHFCYKLQNALSSFIICPKLFCDKVYGSVIGSAS